MIDQDSFSDESHGTHGNCYAACITSILERPLVDLAEFDRLLISGTAGLGGALTVALLDPFVPSVGESFELLSGGTLAGSFDTVSLPSLASGFFTVSQTGPAP